MTDDENTVSRRNLVRTAIAGGVTVTAPAFVQVASADTSSGNIELTTTSTIPTDTSIDVTVYEDTSGDGSADYQQTQSLGGGADEITEFDQLTGDTGTAYDYWLDITLDTSDVTTTATMTEPASLAFPSDGSSTSTATATATNTPINDGSPQTISEMWDNYLLYVASVIMFFTGIGMGSKALTIGALGGYLAFATIALETGTDLLINILYVTLVLIFIGFAFKFWRLEGMGDG